MVTEPKADAGVPDFEARALPMMPHGSQAGGTAGLET